MMSITFSPISCNGLIADAIPSTIRMLKILEPIAFPTAISTSFFLAATMDVTSSGRDVPIETIVNPTRFWLIPKSMAILLAAALKAEQKTAGKARLSSMLKSGKELTVFSLPQKDLKKFVQEAKKYGVLYCTIRERGSKDENAAVDIITRAEDAPKINRVVERFKLAAVDTAEIVQNIEKAKAKRGKTDSMAQSESKESIEEYMGKLDKLFDDIASQSVPTPSQSSEFPSKSGLKEQETAARPISEKKPSVREKLQREQARQRKQKESGRNSVYERKTAEKAAGKRLSWSLWRKKVSSGMWKRNGS